MKTLSAMLPAGTTFRTETAERAEKELYATQERINADWDKLRSDGVLIVESSILTVENAVGVGVENDSPEVRAQLTNAYGPGLVITQDRVYENGADACVNVDGLTIEHQWVVDFDAVPGDSGAPYFTTNQGVTLAWGIHSDSTSASPPGGKAWYSPMSRVFSVLSNAGHPIVLCTDQYCGL
jgi:hypothetical protein